MKIEIDTDNLTAIDRTIIATLAVSMEWPESAPSPTVAEGKEKAEKNSVVGSEDTKPQKKAKKPAKEPEPEPEPAKEPEPEPTKEPEPTPEPEPEPEPSKEPEPDNGSESMDDKRERAVGIATSKISEGKSAEVKTALGEVGAKRVSEVEDDQLDKFIYGMEQ